MKNLYFLFFAVFFFSNSVFAQQLTLQQKITIPGMSYGKDAAIAGSQAVLGVGSLNVAYIFEKNASGNWEVIRTIEGAEVNARNLGQSVAISENQVIVSTDRKAYIFEKKAGSWQRTGQASVEYGIADRINDVAIDGSYAMVANTYADGSFNSAGYVDVYKKSTAGTWSKSQRLTGEPTENRNYFGWQVVLEKDRALISTNTVGGEKSKSAYFFKLNESASWEQEGDPIAIVPSNEDDYPPSVALSGAYAVSSRPSYAGMTEGSVSVYQYSDEGWNTLTTFQASDASAGDYFGEKVLLEGNLLVATTLEKGTYLYNKTAAGTWEEVQILRDYRLYDITTTDGIASGPALDAVYFYSIQQQTDKPRISSFNLVDAQSRRVLTSIREGDVLDLSRYNNRYFNIVANSSAPQGSISTTMVCAEKGTEKFSIERKENHYPFTFFGKKQDRYRNWQPENGDYTLSATPYTASGTTGDKTTIRFTIKNADKADSPAAANSLFQARANATPALAEVVLVDADNHKELQKIDWNTRINLREYANQNFNILVKTKDASGAFIYLERSAEPNVPMMTLRRTERGYPYTAFGDNKEGYRAWEPETGLYKLEVAPLNANGDISSGAYKIYEFQIVDEAVVQATVAGNTTSGLVIYPNPAAARLTASVKTKEIGQVYTLSVINHVGATVYRKSGVGSLEEDISLEGQKAGLYMVVLDAGEEHITERLMLE